MPTLDPLVNQTLLLPFKRQAGAMLGSRNEVLWALVKLFQCYVLQKRRRTKGYERRCERVEKV